jgi:predicted RNA binding protein YcfA (HicA-like mRNA interferase family)
MVLRSVIAVFTSAFILAAAMVASPSPAFSQHPSVAVGTRINNGQRIRCNEGVRLLRARGFRNVRALECRGSHFLYRGDRFRRSFDITVRARDGRITSIRTVRWRH